MDYFITLGKSIRNVTHAYEVSCDDFGSAMVYARSRSQASAMLVRLGYVVRDVNMVG